MGDCNDRKYRLNPSVRYVVCDIEGTTTSIDFVKDVLFPYVRTHVKQYLMDNFDTKETKEDIGLLIEQSKADAAAYPDVPLISEDGNDKDCLLNSLLENIKWQMDLDKKTKALKQLQGRIWQDAYERGEINGHVYDDVVPAFARWIDNGIKIFIYSSGSVHAQKLLFRNSEFGDLTKYLSGHYDTNVGAKVKEESYTRIIKELDCQANEALFLTDMTNEAEPARQVGLNVCVVRRPDNANKQTGDFDWITNFSQIV